MRSPRLIAGLLLLTGWMFLPGCQSFNLFHREKPLEPLPKATAENPVIEVLCLWEAGEGTGLDGLPSRGFVGQLMFFTKHESRPVEIDGNVTIHMFDDTGTPEEQAKPFHNFSFDSEAFSQFLTETNVGAAYQFFLPYTRKGSHRATVSLRVKYTPNVGNPAFSKLASLVLPGISVRKADEPLAATKPASPGLQLAGAEDSSGRTTTTQTQQRHGVSIVQQQSTPLPVDREQELARLRSRLAELSAKDLTEPAASPHQRLTPRSPGRVTQASAEIVTNEAPTHELEASAGVPAAKKSAHPLWDEP